MWVTLSEVKYYWWILPCNTHRSFVSCVWFSSCIDETLHKLSRVATPASKLTQTEDFSPFLYVPFLIWAAISHTHKLGRNSPVITPCLLHILFFVPFFHFLCSCSFVPWGDGIDLCKLPALEESLEIHCETKEKFLPLSPRLLSACTEQQPLSAGTPLDVAGEWEEVLKRDPSHEERLFHGRGQEGISLRLKGWLSLWIKMWSYPKRWGGKKKEIICGFLPPTLTPWTGIFFCTFKKFKKTQTHNPQQNNIKNFSTNPLY